MGEKGPEYLVQEKNVGEHWVKEEMADSDGYRWSVNRFLTKDQPYVLRQLSLSGLLRGYPVLVLATLFHVKNCQTL